MKTLSKIFNGNAVKGRRRFSLNFCNVNKTPLFWRQNKMVAVSPTPYTPELAPCDLFFFPGMNQVQRESLAALDSISVEDFRQCFHQWEQRWDRCIQSQEECFEGD